ncbi:3-keto sterol reductase [Crucibulum laeve]|uniref:3-keto sterol reductase n=1 Tax=Crucibulum laeve TaxID=68775 RepID=A0A5C3MEH4_9AGAR|nr:3-keto sterol reductase [Crucibulum laeve]
MSATSRPIIIVTGANGGVGFGICQRLLVQLSQVNPPDAQPQYFAPDTPDVETQATPTTYDGATIIMACRSTKRAEAARSKLYSFFDAHIEKLRKHPKYDGHAHKFRENLEVQVEYLDLALINSVFRFAQEMSQKYPYISHIVCNAGVASFSGMYWPGCLKQLFTSPMSAITAPTYYLQHSGELSVDNLGWIWQCNMFGHYCLYRSLQPLLSASPLGSRVIWSSSLEASPEFYDSEDWQLRKTEHSYESCKYQIDLVATTLDRRAVKANASGSEQTRHFVSQPGVCSTNVSHALVGPALDILKVLLFYVGRLFGSQHHTIQPFKAAVASVHLAFVPLYFITLLSTASSINGHAPTGATGGGSAKSKLGSRPVRFGAQTDRWGGEYVGLTEVKEWEEHQAEAEKLLDKCEALYQSLRKAEEATVDFETASEHM